MSDGILLYELPVFFFFSLSFDFLVSNPKVRYDYPNF